MSYNIYKYAFFKKCEEADKLREEIEVYEKMIKVMKLMFDNR